MSTRPGIDRAPAFVQENSSPSPEQLEKWDREHVWHSFTQMKHYDPFVVQSAAGCRLTDIHGNEVIDGVSSLWCNVHGHRHPALDRAIKDQVDLVSHVTNLGASQTRTIQLAKRLVDVTPAGLNHVFFCSDGANAIEVALKMAFQYWQQCESPQPGRTKYVALSDAYHGDTLGTVSIGDVPLFHRIFKPLLFEPIRFNAPNAYDWSNDSERENALNQSLETLDQLLASRGNEIAAIVAEPRIQGAAGIKIHPFGFLKGMAELARKHDVFLIADEVAVGFGRTGSLFACETEQVQPDILCLGKGLSGGYLPISATLTSDRIYDAFLGDFSESKTLYHGHTFAGNPLAAAVSLANLEIFEKEQTLQTLQPKIQKLEHRIALLRNRPGVNAPRSLGLVAAFDLGVGPDEEAVHAGYQFCHTVQQYGVRLRPLGNTIIIMPPLAISENEIDQIFDAIDLALSA